VRLIRVVRERENNIDELKGRVDELQAAVEKENQARIEAENKLSSRIQLTAMRKATQIDEFTDAATGLYSEGFFTVTLEARISSARRHLKPVAVVLIEDLNGPQPQPADPRLVVQAVRATIRGSDTACRLLDGSYALVLEDTSETGAIWTVERLRRCLNEVGEDLTMWAGVACYPAHGFSPEEILDRGDLALDLAREWRQDRIEVAASAD
jgi:two-component system cell cycle response regulator